MSADDGGSRFARGGVAYITVGRLVAGVITLPAVSLQTALLQHKVDALAGSLGAAPELAGNRLVVVSAPNPWINPRRPRSACRRRVHRTCRASRRARRADHFAVRGPARPRLQELNPARPAPGGQCRSVQS